MTFPILDRAKTYEEARPHRKAFYEMYWGPLLFVESKDVESLMVTVGRRIESWRAGKDREQTGLGEALAKLVGRLREELENQVDDQE